MSQHQSSPQKDQLNTNLVALVLIFTFIVIGILTLSNMKLQSTFGLDSSGVEIAKAEITPSVVPSSTFVPLTPTPLVSAATMTAVPPTASLNTTPQTGTDAGQATTSNAASYDPALVAKGQQLFMTCSACHGPDARGLPKLGKNLVESEFARSLNDNDLLTFVKTGRPSWDALNTTGIDMPPKGGNPAFTDEDILAIIAYIRSLEAAG